MKRPEAARALGAYVERELATAAGAVEAEEVGTPAEAGSRIRVTVRAEGSEGEIAAIEVPTSLRSRMLEPGIRERVVERARSLGYRYAAVGVPMAEPSGPEGALRPDGAPGTGTT